MFSFGGIIIFSENPKRLTAFYEEVLQSKPAWTGGDFQAFLLKNCYLTIGPHDKVQGMSLQPERLMINLETEHVEQEFERIKSLGATVIAEPYHPSEEDIMSIATFADPDGNYFQLATPFNEVN